MGAPSAPPVAHAAPDPALIVRDLRCDSVSLATPAAGESDTPLVFPGILERDALLAGNPLATLAAMRELEGRYVASPIFGQIYPEIRLNFEQFLGFPCAGVQAMRLTSVHRVTDSADVALLDAFAPRPVLDVIRERAARTRLVIWGEEHHLPQTRSLYESMLRVLWDEGYRYVAAEAFEDADMSDFVEPDYDSGYYLRDPIFASAIRTALELGYALVSYDTRERGSDPSFRDATQAQNLAERVFARDPQARLLVLAGRGHAAEAAAADGWTPMAHVLKRTTGIDPLTLYAPTMTERLTPEEEEPVYRAAVARGLVSEPVIFEHRDGGRLLGSDSFDAYVFFPRTRLIGARPDWMVTTLERTPVPVPEGLRRGSGLRLIQAFRSGAPTTTIAQDQVVVDDDGVIPVLMLPAGRFWLRSIDRNGNVLGTDEIDVR